MRKLEVLDKDVISLLNTKQELANENIKLIEEMETIEKKYETNVTKIKRADEKVRPKILTLLSKTTLGEFEELVRVYFNDKWYMEISDRMEEFKNNWKNRDKKSK